MFNNKNFPHFSSNLDYLKDLVFNIELKYEI